MNEDTNGDDLYSHGKKTAVDFSCCRSIDGWLGSRVVSVLDSGAEGPGSNRSRDAVG